MQWEREMTDRLRRAVNGEKDKIISEYMALTGKSSATLYRIAGKHGFDSGRKARADKGAIRCGVTEGQLQFVSSLIQTTAREVKGVILPLSSAMQLAIDNGALKDGQISEARLQAILRELSMNSTALMSPDPSIRMASLHPNHVHVFDASICIQYYLKGKKGLAILDERDFREKKPKNFARIKNRIYRLILADHFSHYLFLKYYDAAGENQLMTYDFLVSAWRGGVHAKAPFRGVPQFLLMDAGAANVAKGILNLLERLGIEIPKNMPHNPRRQGSAEVAQNIVETHFEAGLRLCPATTIEELNEWAVDWSVWWNSKRKHKRHKMTRTGCWLTIRQEQLRDLPSDEILRDLFSCPEETRTVAQDNTISFRGETYRVKHIKGIRPKAQVRVILRPYDWPTVGVVYNDVEYLASPVGTMAGGFAADAAVIGEQYKAQPDTEVQKVRKANEDLAYGEDRKKDDLPFGGTLAVFGHHADKVAAVPMPRKGTYMEVGRDVAVKEIPIMEMFKRIKDSGVEMTKELNADLREAFGESISICRAEAVVSALVNGEDWKEAAPADDARMAL